MNYEYSFFKKSKIVDVILNFAINRFFVRDSILVERLNN